MHVQTITKLAKLNENFHGKASALQNPQITESNVISCDSKNLQPYHVPEVVDQLHNIFFIKITS